MMHLNYYRSILIAIIIFICAATVLCRAVFQNTENWGIDDWDQHFFYHAVPRDTILRYHQFPLWNPYYCGGNVMLANPQSRFLSPLFLLHLPFGSIMGLKLEIWLHIVLGMFGMFLLSKQIGLGPKSAYLPPAVFMLSTTYAMHLTEGHTWFMAFAYLPYVVFFYLKAQERLIYALAGSAFLALMIFESRTYPTVYTLLFLGCYSVCLAVQKRKLLPVLAFGVIVGIAILLSAISLLPTITFLHSHPRLTGANDHLTFSLLPKILLTGLRSGTPRFDNTRWEWHEYSTYVGIVPLLLFVAGIVICARRKEFPLLITTAFFLLLAFGEFHPLAPWSLLHRLWFFRSMRAPSRFLVIFLFELALLAGIALSWFEKYQFSGKVRRRIQSIACLVLVLWVGYDMISVSSKAFFEAFPNTPQEPLRREEFRQITGSSHAMMEAFLRNEGTINGYEPAHIPVKAIASDDPLYKGEVFLKEAEGVAEIASWSPNRIEILTNISRDGYICINQNFDPSWRAKGGKRVFSLDGIIATDVGRGDRKLVFFYLPTSFITGIIISVVGIGVSLIFLSTNIKASEK